MFPSSSICLGKFLAKKAASLPSAQRTKHGGLCQDEQETKADRSHFLLSQSFTDANTGILFQDLTEVQFLTQQVWAGGGV